MIPSDDNGGLEYNASTQFSLEYPDWVGISVERGATGNTRGDDGYTLVFTRVTPIPVILPGQTFAGALTHGGQSQENLDSDRVQTTMEKDRAYRFELLPGASVGSVGQLTSGALEIRYGDGEVPNPPVFSLMVGSKNPEIIFVPQEAGTYWVTVGSGSGGNSGQGGYLLSMEATGFPLPLTRNLTQAYSESLVDNDIPATTNGAVAINPDQYADANFWKSSDTDWFAVDMTAGTIYQIDMFGDHGLTSGGQSGGNLLNPKLSVRDAQGATLVSDDNGGLLYNSQITFIPEATATYYIETGRSSNVLAQQNQGYTYTITLVTDLADDYPDDTSTIGTLLIGGVATGYIEKSNDRDWFAVEVMAGRTYTFELTGVYSGSDTLPDPLIYGMYDADGNPVPNTQDDNGKNMVDSRLVYTATATGAYYISAAGASENDTGTYTLRVSATELMLTETPTDDIPGDTTTNQTLLKGDEFTGMIGTPGDKDAFRLEVPIGGYRLELSPDTGAASVLEYPIAILLDSAGAAIKDTAAVTQTNHAGQGLTGIVTLPIANNGSQRADILVKDEDVYYLVVQAASLDDTGGYLLTMDETPNTSELDGQDFPRDIATRGYIRGTGTVTGIIENDGAGDGDWFAIPLRPSADYTIDVMGADPNANGGTLADPIVGLADSSGNAINGEDIVVQTNTNSQETLGIVDFNGGEGKNARLNLSSEETGIYYITVYSGNGGFGTYSVHTEERTGKGMLTSEPANLDFPADTSTFGFLTPDGRDAAGRIDPADDVDYLRVLLRADTLYQIDVKGNETLDQGGKLDDPRVHLVDGDGNAMWSDSADIEETHPNRTGIYPLDDDNSGEGDNARLHIRVNTTGTYYIAVSESGQDAIGTDTVRATVFADLPDDTSTSAEVATDSTPSTSIIDPANDVDYFRVLLQADTSYQIDVKGSEAFDRGGTLDDPRVHLADGGGNAMSSDSADVEQTNTDRTGIYPLDDDSGEGDNARLYIRVNTTGTYYIAVSESGQDAIGTYSLVVTPYDTFPPRA